MSPGPRKFLNEFKDGSTFRSRSAATAEIDASRLLLLRTDGCSVRFRYYKKARSRSMHVQHVTIRNFRALDSVDCDFSPLMNVIVGPNGVGKTTIIQAIRLMKGILAPRTPNEAQQVLISLGAASPRFPQRLFINALARDPSNEIVLRSTYILDDDEIQLLKSSVADFARTVAAARLGQTFANPSALMQFMQSPEGVRAQDQARNEIESEFSKIQNNKAVFVGLTMDPKKWTDRSS